MNPVAKQIDLGLKHYERLVGLTADYRIRSFGAVDPVTGQQTVTELACKPKVCPYPLSFRDLAELSRAGLTQSDTRWGMRTAHGIDVTAGDRLTVAGFNYEVMEQPTAVLDEFALEWTFFARRLR